MTKKLLTILTTLFGVSLISFFFIRLAPGDPVMLLIGERGSDPEQYRMMYEALGLDKPLLEQYFVFLGQAIQGEFGMSISTQTPVIEELLSRWPATFELGVVSIILAILLGIPLGVFAAKFNGRFVDWAISTFSLIGYSMPIFWWGLLLILFFSIGLDITPVSGRIGILFDIEPVTGFMFIDTLLFDARSDYGLDAFYSAALHIILPAITLATVPTAVIARMTRASMLEVLSEDYITAVRAKGVSSSRVIWIHALRNCLPTLVTVVGLLFITVAITGAILTEFIFSWPGIGTFVVDIVNSRDYMAIQGSIMLIGVLVLVINLSVEYLNKILEPRVSH